jgi:hypothetical protein
MDGFVCDPGLGHGDEAEAAALGVLQRHLSG